jgi:hypothetical protein
MDRQPITSSSLSEVGYDEGTQTLEIKFSSGGIYSYTGVPPDVHQKLLHAESPGRYFAIYIRACFPCTHLNPKSNEEMNAKLKASPNPSLAKDLKKAVSKASTRKKKVKA